MHVTKQEAIDAAREILAEQDQYSKEAVMRAFFMLADHQDDA